MKRFFMKRFARGARRWMLDQNGLEFWEYMVLAIVMGLVIWAMKPLLIQLFTTIITTLQNWWTAQIGT